jgi:PAS domain S-box-containing protein
LENRAHQVANQFSQDRPDLGALDFVAGQSHRSDTRLARSRTNSKEDPDGRKIKFMHHFTGLKIDIRAPDSLDRLFHFLETPGNIVIADQGSGSGAPTFSWFERTAETLREFADTLMRTAIEHAGAERGLLVLQRGVEQWIAAEATTSGDTIIVRLREAFVAEAAVPESIVHYVMRTQESVILDDASAQNPFSADPYIHRHHARSILCLPLINQTKLIGLLYFENNLTPDVFTPIRIAVLKLLASQAAMSLQNTRLYRDLEEREAKIRRLVDANIIGIFMASLEGEVVEANEAFLKMVGYSREDLVSGRVRWRELTPAEWRDRDKRALEELKATGAVQPFEKEYFRKDGSRVPVLIGGAMFEGSENEGVAFVLDLSEQKRTEDERERAQEALRISEARRLAELTEANEALRASLDAIALVPEVDDFLGQVMAATTRQLNASSSALFLRDDESNFLILDVVFQDGQILTPAEGNFPEELLSVRLGKRELDLMQQPAVVVNLVNGPALIPDVCRSYLIGLGIRTLLIIRLTIGSRLVGSLGFRFTDDREFRPEEIEIARALAAQTSLAVQLTRLAKTARESAVLEERNRLAGEIHDSLAQNFAAIAIQLNMAGEVIKAREGDGVRYLDRAKDLARFGLAEARSTALTVHPFILNKIGLTEAIEMLVERSNVPGRLQCSFWANDSRANDLPLETQQNLLRIAQEAISNAMRHANPTTISVSLQIFDSSSGQGCDRYYLELQVQDNGSGISVPQLMSQSGLGLTRMQNRAKKIGATLNVRTNVGRGTAIVLRLPIKT